MRMSKDILDWLDTSNRTLTVKLVNTNSKRIQIN